MLSFLDERFKMARFINHYVLDIAVWHYDPAIARTLDRESKAILEIMKGGACSIRWLSVNTNIDRRTVQKRIQWLKERGLVDGESSFGRTGGSYSYSIKFAETFRSALESVLGFQNHGAPGASVLLAASSYEQESSGE
jgi:predicted transcriptional regulator